MADYFNPHPREGGDLSSVSSPLNSDNFNPHPREGGDPCPTNNLTAIDDFNPHPREGGDCGRFILFPETAISIHTPAKGVTR